VVFPCEPHESHLSSHLLGESSWCTCNQKVRFTLKKCKKFIHAYSTLWSYLQRLRSYVIKIRRGSLFEWQNSGFSKKFRLLTSTIWI